MPKWLLRRQTTKPMPVAFAFWIHSSIENFETTAPRPFCPSTVAVLTVSAAMQGSAWGSMRPALSSPQYISARLTPCDGTPRLSAATKTVATKSALSLGVPAFCKHADTSLSKSTRSTWTSDPDFTTSLGLCFFPEPGRLPRARSSKTPKSRPPDRPAAAHSNPLGAMGPTTTTTMTTTTTQTTETTTTT
eukprot:CAMPEP_0115093626 /NCGR_PEP_ID=MMETSP0227-20121206/27716_1 /TAXON_ID=89957 /ORGANISM="Polarella glacialis, Strain CCMP 1383" /LENGTH=189 /DNA_ID=CAMNT_0002486157 /DNA_START=1076 /DNA_END=1642 /DNA_ORIENTATION=-